MSQKTHPTSANFEFSNLKLQGIKVHTNQSHDTKSETKELYGFKMPLGTPSYPLGLQVSRIHLFQNSKHNRHHNYIIINPYKKKQYQSIYKLSFSPLGMGVTKDPPWLGYISNPPYLDKFKFF